MLPVLCTTIIMSFNHLKLGVGKTSLMKGNRTCNQIQDKSEWFLQYSVHVNLSVCSFIFSGRRHSFLQEIYTFEKFI